MIPSSLSLKIVLWILIPIACVVGFVYFQIHGLVNYLGGLHEKDMASQLVSVERELQLILETNEQLTEMITDSELLNAYKNRATDSLYRMGKNIIASTLVDRVTFVDHEGIVLARGHDELLFNDSLATDRFFQHALNDHGFSGIVQLEEGISFLTVKPIREFGSIFRGALIVSRQIAPRLIGKMADQLGITITLDPRFRPPVEGTKKLQSATSYASRHLPFPSTDQVPWTLTISKSYAAELEEFKNIRSRILLFSVVATVAALCFVCISVGYLLAPMRRLRTWLEQYRAGTLDVENLDKSILDRNNTNNELGFIAHAAFSTIQELETTRIELQQMHSNLEQLVDTRTQLLSEKTEQLQREIREREKAELKVEGLKNHLQSIFDSMPSILIGVDSAERITFLNVQAQQYSGLSIDKVQGQHVELILKSLSLSTEVFADAVHNSGHWRLHHFKTQHAASPLFVDITTYPFRYDTETGTVIRIDDVTKQVMMEQELFKVEKLRSIGMLAGGIAHDFNNLLAIILGNIDLLLFDTTLRAETRERLKKAEKACIRAKRLTMQLLTFAKGGKPVQKNTDITEILKESGALAVLGDNTICHFTIPEDLWPIYVDRGQIGQVFENIVINAFQAIEEGGSVDIECSNVMSDKDQRLAAMPPGPYVRVTVTDGGSGIPAELVARIFDPYFSTKAEGHGLGLAICYSIIKQHDGMITVESTPGSGTTFFIYVPARPGEVVVNEQGGDIIGCEQRGFKILVMDDDPMIRDVVGTMLEFLNHKGIFARDGAEAIARYQDALNAEEPIDIVLMDLVIPDGMGGKEAVQQILQIQPGAKVIVSSGYSNDPILANFRDYGFAAAIAKPYELKELSQVLQEVMGEDKGLTL